MAVSVLKSLLASFVLGLVLASNEEINFKNKLSELLFTGDSDENVTKFEPNDLSLGGGIITGNRTEKDELLVRDVLLFDRVYPAPVAIVWKADLHVDTISHMKVLNNGAQNATVEEIKVVQTKTKKIYIMINVPSGNAFARVLLEIYGERYERRK